MSGDDKPVTRKDLTDGLTSLETRIQGRFEEMSEQMRDIETAILKAMHGYAQSINAQAQRLSVSDAATQVRLSALEDRVLELETRRRNL